VIAGFITGEPNTRVIWFSPGPESSFRQ